nr:hypothetical protein [Robiginitalea sp. SC105]
MVVLGILIALQINSWQEDRHNQQIRQAYIESFKRDLALDTVLLKELNSHMATDLEYTMGLFERMTSETATRDTLIRIFRKDFDPYYSPSNTLNTSTFERINANGHMDLLDSTLSTALIGHHKDQLQVLGMLEDNINAMFTTYTQSILKFPNLPGKDAFGNPLFPDRMGPLEKRFWDNTDFNELYGTLNGLILNKIQQQNIIVGVRNEMLDMTRSLLKMLNEKY